SIDYFSYGKKYGFVNNYKTFIDNAGLYYQLANLSDTATGHLGNMRSAYHQICNYLKAGNSGLITNGRFEVTNSTGDPYAWTSSGATIQMHSGNQKGNVFYGNQYMSMNNLDSLTSRALQINDGSYELNFLAKSPSGLGSLTAKWGNNSEVEQLSDEWTEYSIDLTGIQVGDQLKFISSQDTELDALELHRGQSFVNHHWNEEFPLIIEANSDTSYFGAFSEWHDLDTSLATLKIDFEMRSKKTTGSNALLELHVEFMDENESPLSTTINSISSANFAVAQNNLASQTDSGNYVVLEYVPFGNPNGNGCGGGSASGLDTWESRWIHNSVVFNIPYDAVSYQIKYRSPVDEFYVLMEDDATPLDSSDFYLNKRSQSNNESSHPNGLHNRDSKSTLQQMGSSDGNNLEQLEITVYPIPSNDQITIGLNRGTFERRKLQIIDGSGKVVLTSFTGDLQTQKFLDISSLAEGVYTVILTSDEDMIRESFLVQKNAR
ncbi:MAG: T9SS type A sorting domain-containing protein, partial [Flavobacteriales bacterium]